jgi:hypothetical protein
VTADLTIDSNVRGTSGGGSISLGRERTRKDALNIGGWERRPLGHMGKELRLGVTVAVSTDRFGGVITAMGVGDMALKIIEGTDVMEIGLARWRRSS